MALDQKSRGSTLSWKLLFPVVLPLLGIYYVAAFLFAWLLTVLLWPIPYDLSRRLYFACPFLPYIWQKIGTHRGYIARIGFEGSYSINLLTRFFTLPLRRNVPDFYILGFPKAGTTTLAGNECVEMDCLSLSFASLVCLVTMCSCCHACATALPSPFASTSAPIIFQAAHQGA